ncbi:MAG: hypothetical protein KAH13_05850 [Tenericutes bacterium]|nr:hypothetical protein [Mycoplasmatota bacterium]
MKKQHIPAIIFYGAIWGIIEATLGTALHILPISIYISGTIMFPIVGYILYKAYEATKSKSALLSIGIVAAGIKAVGFFLPFGSPFKIVNPMISIIMESLMVVLVISILSKDDLLSKISGFVIASIGWRMLYLGYMGFQYISTGYVSDYLMSYAAAINYVIVFGLISAVIAVGIHYFNILVIKKMNFKLVKKINPVISFAMLTLAIVLTLFI